MNQHCRRSWLSMVTTLLIMTCTFSAGVSSTEARGANRKITDISGVVPSITSISLVQGQLVASGTATAIVKGQAVTAPFTAPVSIALAANQAGAAAAGCPILDLSLGPIDLDLLGLIVQTSPICLTITAYQGGGLLGNLLCSIASALSSGIPLNQILGTLSALDLNTLVTGLTDALNGALAHLLDSVLTSIGLGSGATCAILHLELGPLNLNLLGLDVILDNCSGGPVVVDLSGQPGRGNILGNLLCGLLNGGLLNLGTTLQGLLTEIGSLL